MEVHVLGARVAHRADALTLGHAVADVHGRGRQVTRPGHDSAAVVDDDDVAAARPAVHPTRPGDDACTEREHGRVVRVDVGEVDAVVEAVVVVGVAIRGCDPRGCGSHVISLETRKPRRNGASHQLPNRPCTSSRT